MRSSSGPSAITPTPENVVTAPKAASKEASDGGK